MALNGAIRLRYDAHPEHIGFRCGECQRAVMTETADTTARALLETARRAETEGNHEAALRTYRHLTENFARSPEARVAAEALARRSIRPAPGTQLPGLTMPPPPPMRPSAAPRPQHPAAVPVQLDRPMQMPSAISPPQTPHPASLQPPQAPLPVHRNQLRAHPPRYRFGRAIAYLTGLLGGSILVAAVVAALLNLGATFGYVSSPVFASMLIGWPLILLTNATGLFLVLLSQMARATFDAADATRHQPPR